MERYCTLNEEVIEKADEFKWEVDKDFKTLSLYEIYEQMIKAYYFPISIFELYRNLMDETNEKEFIKKFVLDQTMKHSSIVHENVSDENKKERKILRYRDAKTDRDVEIELKEDNAVSEEKKGNEGISEEKKGDEEISKKRDDAFEMDNMACFLYDMNSRDRSRIDNEVQNIIREQISQNKECFYLDIIQALLYSLRYYQKRDTMVYLNPFQEHDRGNNNRKDFSDSWNQFKRKGADSIRRDGNKTKKEIKDIKMLSDFSVEVPLDTKVEITSRGIIKISDFAPDVIRFFIEKEQEEGKSKYNILDLFSEKRRDRFTPSNYTKSNIERFLNKFKRYSNNSDNIVEQFLLEQCFGLDISKYVYTFIENVIFTDKIVNEEVKKELANSITALVRELRLCEPMLSKKLVLDEVIIILKQCPQTMNEYQETIINYACSRLAQAVQIEHVLIEELNFIYRGFSGCFFYALFKSSDGDWSKIDKRLCDEIKRVKGELEGKNKQIDGIEYKKGYDILFPYIQKAMMVER